MFGTTFGAASEKGKFDFRISDSPCFCRMENRMPSSPRAQPFDTSHLRRQGWIYHLNYGLAVPQSRSSLPVPRQPLPSGTERKPKQPPRVQLRKKGPCRWEIFGGWELTSQEEVVRRGQWDVSRHPEPFSLPGLDTRFWYNATVPGTVLTTLVDQGVFSDPGYGLNNLAIPEALARQVWWYRTRLPLPSGCRKHSLWLCFEGINYSAEVWLNGHRLGSIRGAFRRARFPILASLLRKENILAVRVEPPPHPGIAHEQSVRAGMGPNGGSLCQDGPTFLSSEGWDWMPAVRDRNSGIWRDVFLQVSGPLLLGDPRIRVRVPSLREARVDLQGEVSNSSSRAIRATVRVRFGGRLFQKKLRVPAGGRAAYQFDSRLDRRWRWKNPALWWPNGEGKQNLHPLRIEVVSAGSPQRSDHWSGRIGLREFSYELMVHEQGKFRRVLWRPAADRSDRPVFNTLDRRAVPGYPGVLAPSLVCRKSPGITNLPEDPMGPFLAVRINGRRVFLRGGNWGMDDFLKRHNPKRLRQCLQLHRHAHLNLIRNWTGETTQRELYELCDELGILVWNDFWISTEGYNLPPADEPLFLENSADVIRRFGHHACLLVWCGRNEGFPPASLEERLARDVAALDGTRLFQPSSTLLNLRASGPWDYFPDLTELFVRYPNGSNTETGAPSIPTWETLQVMLPPCERWPIGDAWAYHDFHHGPIDIRRMADGMNRQLGVSRGAEEFCRKAQRVNHESYRAMFEAWTSRMWGPNGMQLLWMTHPAWPSLLWQMYTHDLETHGAFWGVRKACEPVHAQLELPEDLVAVVNFTPNNLRGMIVAAELFDFRGQQLAWQEARVTAWAGERTEVFRWSGSLRQRREEWLRLSLRNAQGKRISENWYGPGYGSPGKHRVKNLGRLPPARLEGEPERSGCFRVRNTAPHLAHLVSFNLRRPGGQRILPAFFSEGCLTLLPGEERSIRHEVPEPDPPGAYITAEGWNVPRTRLT